MVKFEHNHRSWHLSWASEPSDAGIRKRYAAQVARRLRSTRTALRLSQAEVCRRSNIKQSTYNQYEKAVNIINRAQAFRLCNALGITLDWIYFGDLRTLPNSLAHKLTERNRDTL
jgi:transcriptional regulator with XRE-family HTH domain